MRTHARVVVIGGGVTGCSVLYHLACAGWTDCLLIERSELTSGSTWHAAGGTDALAPSATMTWLHRYSFELYPKLEAQTGQSCGFHHVGGVMLARTERFHLRWWERWLPASGVELESMMTRLAGFAIAGPRACDLLERPPVDPEGRRMRG